MHTKILKKYGLKKYENYKNEPNFLEAPNSIRTITDQVISLFNIQTVVSNRQTVTQAYKRISVTQSSYIKRPSECLRSALYINAKTNSVLLISRRVWSFLRYDLISLDICLLSIGISSFAWFYLSFIIFVDCLLIKLILKYALAYSYAILTWGSILFMTYNDSLLEISEQSHATNSWGSFIITCLDVSRHNCFSS